MALSQPQRYQEEMFLYSGTVQQILDNKYVVAISQQRVIAVRAVGCLLVPEGGDMVLLAEGPANRGYILSVLHRAADRPARVCLPPDTVVAAKGGDLLLQADEAISLSASDLGFYADNGVAEIRETNFTGNRVEISATNISRNRSKSNLLCLGAHSAPYR